MDYATVETRHRHAVDRTCFSQGGHDLRCKQHAPSCSSDRRLLTPFPFELRKPMNSSVQPSIHIADAIMALPLGVNDDSSDERKDMGTVARELAPKDVAQHSNGSLLFGRTLKHLLLQPLAQQGSFQNQLN